MECQMIQLNEVCAVVIFSNAPPRLAAWYKKVFAHEEIVDTPDFIGLHAGAVSLFIQKTSEGHAPGIGGIRPHFAVEDCGEAFRMLIKAGAGELVPVTDNGDEYIAAVQDPEGNPIGLISFK
jgi:hypothetical protein